MEESRKRRRRVMHMEVILDMVKACMWNKLERSNLIISLKLPRAGFSAQILLDNICLYG